MTRNLHPNPTIATWLADGPDALSPQRRAEVKSIARATAQRRLVVLPLPSTRGLRLVLAAAALGLLTIALAIASGSLNLQTPPVVVTPTPTPTPSPSLDVTAVPACWAEERALSLSASGRLAVEGLPFSVSYSIPAGFELVGGATDGVLGLGTPYGLPHRLVGGGTEVFLPESRGVLVSDVTAAVRHGSHIVQPRIGTDARTFLADLDAPLAYGDGTIDFQVDEVTQTEVGGRPAWTARVSVPELDPPMWSHIDRPPRGERDCAVEFGMPSRVWVLDVGSSIALVQAWAADEEELAAWLPDAMRIIDSLAFRAGGDAGPTPGESAVDRAGSAAIRRPWVTLTVDYVLRDGLALYVEDRGFLSFRQGNRGVNVDEVTNAHAHYTNYTLLGTDAASFLAGLAANEQFTIGEVRETTLDGHAALTTTATAGHYDTHAGTQLVSTGMVFDEPSRIIVADVDGAIVLVHIWAESEQELEAWLPEALAFVDSMRFSVVQPALAPQ